MHYFAVAYGDGAAQRRRKFKQPFFEIRWEGAGGHAQQPHVRELQALGGMHAHQLHRVRMLALQLGHLGFSKQRNDAPALLIKLQVFEECSERGIADKWLFLPRSRKAENGLDYRVMLR